MVKKIRQDKRTEDDMEFETRRDFRNPGQMARKVAQQRQNNNSEGQR